MVEGERAIATIKVKVTGIGAAEGVAYFIAGVVIDSNGGIDNVANLDAGVINGLGVGAGEDWSFVGIGDGDAEALASCGGVVVGW